MNGLSAAEFPGKRRIHVGLAVSDLGRSKSFYEALFGIRPAKERPGYVKFEPRDPSVNLTLNETGTGTTSPPQEGHFGVQVKSTAAVQEAISRFREAGLDVTVEEKTTCCYAVQDKVWVTDPDGNRWEVFVVLEPDAQQRRDTDSDCCDSGSTQSDPVSCC
ncbi:MAG: VOC family protein [Phycisphaerales bacterium]|nr:VOC family protein [Phycisphaerales bacterium]